MSERGANLSFNGRQAPWGPAEWSATPTATYPSGPEIQYETIPTSIDGATIRLHLRPAVLERLLRYVEETGEEVHDICINAVTRHLTSQPRLDVRFLATTTTMEGSHHLVYCGKPGETRADVKRRANKLIEEWNRATARHAWQNIKHERANLRITTLEEVVRDDPDVLYGVIDAYHPLADYYDEQADGITRSGALSALLRHDLTS